MFSLNRACCTLHSMVVVAQAEFNDVVHGQQPFFIDHVYQVGSKQQDMINKTPYDATYIKKKQSVGTAGIKNQHHTA